MDSNWTKASELPMHNGDVLVTDGERIGIGNYQTSKKQHPISGNYGYWSLMGSVFYEPTHWMELPEPPEEEKQLVYDNPDDRAPVGSI